MSPDPHYTWQDGAFCDDSLRSNFRNTTPGGGCFSTALVAQGKPHLLAAHIERLQRDARTLGIEPPAPELLARAFRELGLKHFRVGRGIIRVDVQSDAAGMTHVLAASRSLTDTPDVAEAIVHAIPHPGPNNFPGSKLVARDFFTAAHDAAHAAHCHEALLFDAAGFLVEGSHSNIIVVCCGGTVRTPRVTRGCVNGIARNLLLQGVADLTEGEIAREDIVQAREIILINAVRGAVPIVRCDGKSVGDEKVGPWTIRLQEAWSTLRSL